MSESRYRAVKAYENLPWIHSRTARPMRILAEYLEPEARFEEMKIEDTIVLPGGTINRHCKIKHAIIDSGCDVPEGSVIGYDAEQDRANGFRVSAKGVVLVTRGMLGQ